QFMATKGKKATAQDAQILMQLYDLRREPVMRKARDFVIGQFSPSTYEEFQSVMSSFGSEQNAYARQALTYWDMAAAMVLEGALHEGLFFKCNGELHFLFAKFGHYLPRLRKRSEEHTSELQSLAYLVCRLLLEKKKKNNKIPT